VSARLLTAEDVAEWLQVTVEWVHQMARTGQMPAMKLGRYWRFDQAAVGTWLMNRQGGAYKRRTA